MNKREKHKLFGMFNSREEEPEEEDDQAEHIPVNTEEDSSYENENEQDFQETQQEEGEDMVENEEAGFEEDTEGQLAVDMFQTKDNYVIKSTIAGVRPEDIDVSVNENILTITGERAMEEEVRDKDYFLQECYWGEFSRSVELPEDFDPDSIAAEIKDGILTITIPKSERAKPKKIQVKG